MRPLLMSTGSVGATARSGVLGLTRQRRRRRRVRERDELDTRAPLARLRKEVHELVDLARHLLLNGDAQRAQLLYVERVIVGPLPGGEFRRYPLGVGFRVVPEQQALRCRLDPA